MRLATIKWLRKRATQHRIVGDCWLCSDIIGEQNGDDRQAGVVVRVNRKGCVKISSSNHHTQKNPATPAFSLSSLSRDVLSECGIDKLMDRFSPIRCIYFSQSGFSFLCSLVRVLRKVSEGVWVSGTRFCISCKLLKRSNRSRTDSSRFPRAESVCSARARRPAAFA